MKKFITQLLFIAIVCFPALQSHAQIITLVKYNWGGFSYPYWFYDPSGIAVDRAGNIYVSQIGSNHVVKIDVGGNAEVVVNALHGYPGFSGDGGPATAAMLSRPQGLVTDGNGNVYIADFGNSRIRKVDTLGIITTIAGNGTPAFGGDGGAATLASIDSPTALTIDKWGNIYVADYGNHRIRRIDTTGIITTVAGTRSHLYSGDGGPATAAGIEALGNGITTDTAGNVYFIDKRIRKISSSGVITAFAGDGLNGFSGDGGTALAAQISTGPGGALYAPMGGLACDNSGNLFISDGYNGRVRKVDTGGNITTIAGYGFIDYSYYTEGVALATTSTIYLAGNIATDSLGNIYVIDAQFNYASKIVFNTQNIPQIFPKYSQTINVCQNADTFYIDNLLMVFDNPGFTETWGVDSPAGHGTVIASYSAVSGDSLLTPSGIGYKPDSGFVGLDSFKIKVSNGDSSAICKFLVYVKPPVTTGSIIGDSVVCAGSGAFILTDTIATTSGGWYGSSSWDGYTYTTDSSESLVVFSYSVGVDTMRFTNGCGIATKIITVNPAPRPISVALQVCVGDSTMAYEADTAGVWSMTNSTAVITSSGEVTGLSNGMDTAVYTIPTGCSANAIIMIGNNNPITGDSLFCVGYEDYLYFVGGEGSWSSSNASLVYFFEYMSYMDQYVIVEPIAAGLDTITFSNSCGSVTRTITINPIPNISIVPSPLLCRGDTLHATVSFTGGIWSSYDTSVVHVDSGGNVTESASNNVWGFTDVIYILPTGCTAYSYVNFSAAPDSLTGIASICVGSNLILHTGITGGRWSSSDSAILNINTYGQPYGVSAGLATVTYTTSCGFATRSVTVNAAPAPIILAPNICIGDTLFANDSTAGGTWSVAFNHISISSSGVVTTVSAPFDYVYYTLPNGCSTVDSINIGTSAPPPIVGTATACVGNAIMLTDGALTGTWSSSNDSVLHSFYSYSADLSSREFLGIAAGTDTITFSNGCGSVTKIITINPNPAPISLPTRLCLGDTITATDTTSGGTWSIVGDTANVSITSTGLVTALSLPMYEYPEIIYSLPTGCRSIVYEYVDTVLHMYPITGDSVFCSLHSSFFLADIYSGGYWSSSNTSVADIYSYVGELYTNSPGVTIISYEVVNGCGTYTQTKSITVNSIPAIGVFTDTINVCTGVNYALSEYGNVGIWSISNTNASLFVDSSSWNVYVWIVSAGRDTIVDYDSSQCGLYVQKYYFNISPADTVGVITGPDYVCTGGTITLSDTTSGGAWSIPAYDTGIATISSTGVVHSTGHGVISVFYSGVNSCGSYWESKNVFALPAPGVYIDTENVCLGADIYLYSTGYRGRWRASNVKAALYDTSWDPITVRGEAIGIDTVTYTDSTGCGEFVNMYIINVIPNTIGPITGPDHMCLGSSETLSDSTSGGSWSIPYYLDTIASITATGIVNTTAAGEFVVYYSVTTSCGYYAQYRYITSVADSGTIIDTENICVGMSLSLVAPGEGGIWRISNANATFMDTFSNYADLQGNTPGMDTIIYTDTTECGVFTNKYVVEVNPYIPIGPIICPDTVCTGNIVTVTDSTAGGYWEYTRSVDSPYVYSSDGVFAHLPPGSVSIYYIVNNACGRESIDTSIYVHTTPYVGVMSGIDSLCAGSGALFYVSSSGGGTWSASNSNAVITGSYPSYGYVTGVTAGIDSIRYTIADYCGRFESSMVITVNPLPVAGTILGFDSLCVGATDTFTETVPGGVWLCDSFTSSITATGVMTGLSAGSDFVAYSVTNGCGTVYATMDINILPIPQVSAIYGADSVCQAHTITLSDSMSGGNWIVRNTNAFIDSSGILTGAHSGYDTALYVMSNYCGSDTARYPVRIQSAANSGTITGSESVCFDSLILLLDTVSGGTWLAQNPHATVSGGTVHGFSAGVDTILYLVSNACGTDTAFHTIVVNSWPNAGAIVGPDSVCTGLETTLSDSVAGGMWSTGNSNATISGGVLTGINAGNEVVIYTDSNSCGTASTSISITIVDPPVVNIIGQSYACIGKTDSLIGSPEGGIWSSSDTNALVSSGAVTGVAAGHDTVIYAITTHVCGIVKFSLPIIVYTDWGCDSIDGVSPISKEQNINVYPNPAQIDIVITSSVGIRQVSISNIIGQCVFEQVYDDDKVFIDLEAFPGGVYFVKINNEVVRKIDKQ